MPYRNSGKRHHRKRHCKPPRPVTVDTYLRENKPPPERTALIHYGIITKYHGSRGSCNVSAINHDGKVIEYTQIKLKGSLLHRKCEQQLVVGYFVLVDSGQIILVYNSKTRVIIDIATRQQLSQLSGIANNQPEEDILFEDEARTVPVKNQSSYSNWSMISDSEEEDEEDES